MKLITIKINDIDQRIDNFLKKMYPKLSLSHLYRYLRTKRIKVNNKKIDINYRLKLNDAVSLYVNDTFLSSKLNKNDFLLAPNKINAVYEDENLIVVNKPVGLVVHDDETKTVDTLIHRVQHYLYDKKSWNPEQENSFTPSLLHRLDRNTSGLVMIAKNALTLKILNEKIKKREVNKFYLCRVYGIVKPKNAILTAYLTRNASTKLVSITSKPINNASEKIITEYHTISTDINTSLLEIKLVTGKTHQIRAHMAFIGHPLVGEKKYTTSTYSSLDKVKHQQLVAYKIAFNFQTSSDVLENLNHKIISINCKI